MAGRPHGISRRDPLITGINITPLVDVVLVLLVVLMVVSTYIVAQSWRVELPRQATERDHQAEPLTLTILRDGRILLDEQPVLETEVEHELTVALRNRSNDAVVISADKTIPYGRVVQFVDLARRSGAARFAIKTEEGR